MEELTRVRNELGWSQQRLADESGVNKATINQIERGRRSPNVETLEKLANAMDREVGEFFPKAQASLFEDNPEQRRTPCLAAWTEYINELATDWDEWSFGFHKGADPADLPEREFLAFVGGVSVAGETYSRTKSVVESLAAQHQDEDLARAWRRLSRVVLAMATPGVEQRAGQLDPGALPDNVVHLERKTA